MTNAFIAGTVVAVLAGVVGYFVVLRRLSFACEALSHGGFAGATGAVVLGEDVFLGLLVFTSITGGFMGLIGDRIRGRVPVRLLSVAFMVLLAITASASVQVVGVLLIFALLILPAAAA